MASIKLYTDLDLSGNKLLNVPGLTDVNGVFIGSAATPTPTVVVLSSATEAALRTAIANASGPTTIMWSGTINLTSVLELQGKTGLTLNCYGAGSLIRSDSPSMIVIRGNIKDCGIRGISFSNTSTGSGGSMILINEEGVVDGLAIEHSTFVNTGTGNNAISSNSSGGANDQFITTHKNVRIRYNKFGGAVMPGAGISRMAVELKNHSADGPGPIQWCENIIIDYNEIYNTGTGDPDGFGISLSGLFRYSSTSHNVIVDAKRYSIESVLVSDSVIEDNDITDVVNTSNGVSLSNGYKAAGSLPAGSNRKMKVRNNRINVKGRAILSYYVSNSEFTANRCKSWQRNEWIGDENTIQKNRFEVFKDWNAAYFANSSRNRIIDNDASTYYYNNGVYTSSVFFFDTGSNNSYVRSNSLIRPTGSYNVHIEQASGVSNDIGTASGSATNALNTYVTSDAPAGQPISGLPVGGITGQFLQKKSATDYDMRWTSFPHQLKNAYPVGNWIQPIEGAYVETGTTIGNANGIYFIPFYVQRGITISDLGARVTTAVANSLFQLCIYASRPTDFLPGVKVANTADMSGATVATISASVAESTASLDPFTIYWHGVNINTVGLGFMASSVLTSVYTSLIGHPTVSAIINAVPNASMVVTSNVTYGTYPDLTNATISSVGANAKRHAIPLLKVSGYVS